jgi:hypothetical protein
VEAKRVKVEAPLVEAKRAKKRAEDAKATMKAEKQENAAQIPKSRGVGWHKKRGKWEVAGFSPRWEKKAWWVF